MALITFSGKTEGGRAIPLLGKVIQELRGLTVTVGTGSAVGVKVILPGFNPAEDTILSVVRSVAGVLNDVTANYSIVDTKATATVTCASAAADSSVTVDGVTYTARANPVLPNEYKQQSTDAAQATALANCINKYLNRYNGSKYLVGNIVATVAGAVVTLKAVTAGSAGNSLTLTGTAGYTLSGATFTGGAASNGITSSVDHSATSSLLVTWYNRVP